MNTVKIEVTDQMAEIGLKIADELNINRDLSFTSPKDAIKEVFLAMFSLIPNVQYTNSLNHDSECSKGMARNFKLNHYPEK